MGVHMGPHEGADLYPVVLVGPQQRCIGIGRLLGAMDEIRGELEPGWLLRINRAARLRLGIQCRIEAGNGAEDVRQVHRLLLLLRLQPRRHVLWIAVDTRR
jgi:hypothetical protein